MINIETNLTPAEDTAAAEHAAAGNAAVEGVTVENAAAESPTVESACRDIDRYVAETSQPPSAPEEPLSPSRRLQALGRRQAGTFQPPLTVGMLETPLFPDKG